MPEPTGKTAPVYICGHVCLTRLAAGTPNLLPPRMVDFHNPTVILLDAWALTKLCHAMDGLYLWEFLINLDYEWSVVCGHRPYRWTIWVYSLTRVAGLVAIILNLVGLDVTTKVNCQVSTVSCIYHPFTPAS